MPDKVEPIDGMHVDMKDAKEFKKTATVKALQMDAPFSVLTLEGPLTGEADDFLVEGVKGERWVVRKDIFEETYVLVESEDIAKFVDEPGGTVSETLSVREGRLLWRIHSLDREVHITRPDLVRLTKMKWGPKIVCLCGSTRFWKAFQREGLRETMEGNIVLSIGAASGTDEEHFGNLPRDEYDSIKTELDELHLRKIDLADEVLILNVDGYIGESTGNELAYAKKQSKTIRFLEPIETEEKQ